MNLRMWIAVILAWGVLLAWVKVEDALGYPGLPAPPSPIAWGLCSFTAFAVAWSFGPSLRGRGARTAVSVVLAAVLAVTIYVAWAHYRVRYFSYYTFDKDFPYPDPWIGALYRWFDVRNPVPPGSLKVHGEFPRVTWLLGTLISILAAVAGLLLGLLWDQPGATEGIKRECSDREPR
jgi:hypothetical protein